MSEPIPIIQDCPLQRPLSGHLINSAPLCGWEARSLWAPSFTQHLYSWVERDNVRVRVSSSVGNGGTRTFLDFTHLSVVSVKI